MAKQAKAQSVPVFTSIRLRNFKAYRDSGDIPLAPLTVILGANNAGKSTILQALLLLKQTLEDTNVQDRLVTSGPLVELNTYRDILHGRRIKQGTRTFGISLKAEPTLLLPTASPGSRVYGAVPAANRLDLEFSYKSKANEIEVKSARYSTEPGVNIFEIDRGGQRWRLKQTTQDDEPLVKVAFKHFLPYLVPSAKQKDYDRQEWEFFNTTLSQSSTWTGYLTRISRIEPLRARMPWYSGIGARASSELGLGGSNLIGALASEKPLRPASEPLLDVVDDWVSSKLKVLKELRLEKLDKGGLVRSLVGDGLDGVTGINVAAMGEGISQMLPIIASALRSRQRECLLIEQPEIHLHPALQADLTDLFIDCVVNGGRQIIIETHSEHLLLRLRRRIAERKTIHPDEVSILFVERAEGGSRVRRLDLNERGHFAEWPEGFFDQAYQEALAIATAGQQTKSG